MKWQNFKDQLLRSRPYKEMQAIWLSLFDQRDKQIKGKTLVGIGLLMLFVITAESAELFLTAVAIFVIGFAVRWLKIYAEKAKTKSKLQVYAPRKVINRITVVSKRIPYCGK